MHCHASGEHDPHLIDRRPDVAEDRVRVEAADIAARAQPVELRARHGLEQGKGRERSKIVVSDHHRLEGWLKSARPTNMVHPKAERKMPDLKVQPRLTSFAPQFL